MKFRRDKPEEIEDFDQGPDLDELKFDKGEFNEQLDFEEPDFDDINFNEPAFTDPTLEETLDELSDQVAKSFFQTIQLLASVVSLNEKYYETSHSRFVSEKSALIAQALNLDETDVLEVKVAGLLHDIGKIGFKDVLMYKYPTELNHVDYKLYMMHSEIGMHILKKHEAFENIAEIVFQHHEKINGAGFPRNLKGTQILPGAAILGVVDAFHEGVYRIRQDRTKMANSTIKYYSGSAYLESTKERFSNTMTYLHSKKGILYDIKVVESFTDIMEIDREEIGVKKVHRIDVQKIEEGMAFARDYYTTYGLLIVAHGEAASEDSIRALKRFAEYGQIPDKLLVMI
ncbi:MAG: hypothetical protein QG635_514 [Bacteroidota bacterium]|nr:hypothetical protein [Bacteroidota bacterium]